MLLFSSAATPPLSHTSIWRLLCVNSAGTPILICCIWMSCRGTCSCSSDCPLLHALLLVTSCCFSSPLDISLPPRLLGYPHPDMQARFRNVPRRECREAPSCAGPKRSSWTLRGHYYPPPDFFQSGTGLKGLLKHRGCLNIAILLAQELW